jgi:hypothetical protein
MKYLEVINVREIASKKSVDDKRDVRMIVSG